MGKSEKFRTLLVSNEKEFIFSTAKFRQKYEEFYIKGKNKGIFLNKTDYAMQFAEECDISPSTLGNWKAGYNGPTKEVFKNLIEFFMCESMDLLVEKEREIMSGSKDTVVYSNFTKEKLFEIYKKMNEMVEAMDDEDTHARLHQEIRVLGICVNPSIYIKCEEFIEKEIAPMVYDESFFDDAYEGVNCVDGVYQLSSEEETRTVCGKCIMKAIEVGDKLEAFAKEKLLPIFTS